jgi:hypothetical protein
MLFLDRALTRSVKTRRNRAIAVINPGKVTNEWRSHALVVLCRAVLYYLYRSGIWLILGNPAFLAGCFLTQNQRPAGAWVKRREPGRMESGLKRHNLNRPGSNWYGVNRYGSEPHGLDIARIAAAGGAEMSLVQFA